MIATTTLLLFLATLGAASLARKALQWMKTPAVAPIRVSSAASSPN